MERDGHSGNAANKTEIGTAVEETQHPDIHQEKLNQQECENTGTSSRIQFKEFLPSRSSQEYERGRRSVRKGPGRGASTSPPPAELGPGFAEYRGDVGGHGYDETEVDIIAVPCPGADPVQTWIYDHDVSSDSNYPAEVGSHLSRNTAQTSHSSSSSLRRASPWVTLKLRESASIARVFLYRHRTLQEGMNLKSLSNDLLEQVQTIRADGASRPLFFIAHSIGGLVVKHALVRACEKSKYQSIMDHCHGVTFFGTPHRGSSYLSMPTLKNSIRDLLQLEAPLPRSLTDELLVDNPILTALHKKFVDIASELRLWSFYETRECLLSGTGAGLTNEVQFTAPLVSVKSALLEIWQEDIFGVESDHSHVASFGPNNDGVLASYLGDLAGAIVKAAELSRDHKHHPLYLDNYVKVEVIGFYEDPDAWNPAARQYVTQTSDADTETGSVIRLYQTNYPFKDFLRKGPEKCLSERLHDRSKKKGRNRSPHRSVPPPKETGDDASSIRFGHNHATGTGPEIIITSGMERPSLAFLVPPAHTAPDLRPSSPESNASVSTTMSDPASLRRRDVAGDGPLTVDMLAKQQAETLLKEHELSSPAGFSRPDPSLRRFTWIHLPFNNPVWVKDLFNTLEKTQGHDFSRLFDYDNWESKHTQNRHSDTQPAYLKSHCKYLTSTSITSPRPTPLFGPSPASLSSSPNCLYVYLPYLHFDTYHSMIKRRKIIRERRERGRAKPVPKHIADEESLELRMIWEYIGFDPPLNCRRTLDQFGHHSLRDTNSRDDDQMLYKLTKRDLSHTNKLANNNNTTAKPPAGSSLYSNKGSGASSYCSVNDESVTDSDAELKDGYVLMVDQLWLWSVDMATLTTFFPRRHSTPTEGTLFHQADLRNSVYNELNGDLTGRTENTLDLAALIVWHAVIVFLERSTHPNLEVFRLFDEAIGMLAERMTLSMKQFRLLDVEDDEENEDESDWSDYEGESPASIKKRHRRELERSERENRENTSALLELRDLEDELTTLQKLFETQESTIKQMREYYLKFFRGTTQNGQYYLNEALEYLDDFKQQTSDMLKRVDTTRNDYEKMLEMVQRQAQVDEVRWSRLQAELASSQNLSVMIFTTFTVIFLPLTFFTGLFGMNTIEWQNGDIPSLAFIGAVSLPASATLIILSLVAAFSWRVQRSFRATYKGLKASWKFAKSIYAERWEPVSRKEKKRRRRLEKKRKHQEKQSSHNDGTYDFWEMVKKQQRNMRYQIPNTNRKL